MSLSLRLSHVDVGTNAYAKLDLIGLDGARTELTSKIKRTLLPSLYQLCSARILSSKPSVVASSEFPPDFSRLEPE